MPRIAPNSATFHTVGNFGQNDAIPGRQVELKLLAGTCVKRGDMHEKSPLWIPNWSSDGEKVAHSERKHMMRK